MHEWELYSVIEQILVTTIINNSFHIRILPTYCSNYYITERGAFLHNLITNYRYEKKIYYWDFINLFIFFLLFK